MGKCLTIVLNTSIFTARRVNSNVLRVVFDGRSALLSESHRLAA